LPKAEQRCFIFNVVPRSSSSGKITTNYLWSEKPPRKPPR